MPCSLCGHLQDRFVDWRREARDGQAARCWRLDGPRRHPPSLGSRWMPGSVVAAAIGRTWQALDSHQRTGLHARQRPTAPTAGSVAVEVGGWVGRQ